MILYLSINSRIFKDNNEDEILFVLSDPSDVLVVTIRYNFSKKDTHMRNISR